MPTPDQVLELILKAVFGPVVPGGEAIQVAARRLAEPPNNEASARLAQFCQQFVHVYKGWNYNIDANGERWLLRQMAAFKPAVVFDVGSNQGDWTAAVLAEIPTATVHAFEIIEQTSAALAKRMEREPRAVVNRFGLPDRSGTLAMRAFESSSKLASCTAYPHGRFQELSCRVRSGDDYLREQSIERIDLLKLDVEGAERLVLQGFSQALDEGKIDVIQFEYGKVAILTHFLLKDFYDLLEGKRYSVGKIYPDHVDFRAYRLEDEDFLGPNYLAVRRERAEIIEALQKQKT
jgi:FkbM family methyltransferase